MNLDQQNGAFEVKCVSNSEEGNGEGLIVNLHPDFPIPQDQLHQDKVFPWLKQVREVGMAQLAADHPGFDNQEEFAKARSEIQTVPEAWGKLRKAWSLTNNGRLDLANRELDQYKIRQFHGPYDLPNVIFHFCGGMLTPAAIPLFQDAAEAIGSIRNKAPNEFDKFKVYYLKYWKDSHLERYFIIFSEYFRDYSELTQTLLMVQYGFPLSDDASVSSTAFSRTKMLYGNLYETLISNLTTIACLENIRQGRSFDAFQEMNLKTYLSSHKAQRKKVVEAFAPFSNLTTYLESTLRNASHHGAITIVRSSGKLTYRSGGTGAAHTMSYAEYLYMCNQLFLRLCALLMLELMIGL